MSPIFQKNKNRRSFINMISLAELIRLIIIKNQSGLFYSQDNIYFSKSKVINDFRFKIYKRTTLVSFLSELLRLLILILIYINNIYGNKFYEFKYSIYKRQDCKIHNLLSYINKL
jgi:hypothetical protein